MISAIVASRKLVAGGVAALILSAGTLIVAPAIQPAFAEPVRIEGVVAPGFADVVEKVQPAVVSVRVTGRTQSASLDDDGPRFREGSPEEEMFRRFFREFGPQFRDEERREGSREGRREDRRERRNASQGSGFFISGDGFIVTNHHVVEGGSTFTVVMNDGEELDAKLIGTDERTDLALLKVDSDRDFTYVTFADDSAVRVGEWVVAVGNPFGLGGTVTAGIVSALGRDIGAGPYSDFIQIDAAVNRGNSGGPAFNMRGEVVGVNTAIFSPSGGNVGIAFAIPASTTKAIIEDLRSSGQVTRGFIGVRIQPLTDEISESLGLQSTEGALVASVVPDGPAAAAGIEPGDVILSVDGSGVENPRDLTRRIGAIKPGASATIEVLRNGERQNLSLKLAELESQQASLQPEQPVEPAAPSAVEGLGLEVTPNDGGEGLVITAIDPDGLAADQGLAPGDVILELNGRDIKDIEDISKALEDARKDERRSVLMRVTRDDNARFLALPMARG
ncbi:MAG: Do family serine endopeptidase [Rhizobiaceae bacterium]|nr:Do family serine endopeptidase [Rhizobiaceae bacterium]